MKTIYHIDAITKSLREICKKTTDYRDLTINTYFPKGITITTSMQVANDNKQSLFVFNNSI